MENSHDIADNEPVLLPASTESPLAGLASLPAKAVVTQAVLARLLGRTTRTVRRMVVRFELPPGMKMGRELMWFAGDILSWWEKRADLKRQSVTAHARASASKYGW